MPTVDTAQRPGRQPQQQPAVDGRRWTLSHQPDAPARGRELSREVLRSWNVPPAVAAEILLVVSELVTNAFEYARPPITLRLDRDDDTGQVRVEVTDGGPAASQGEWAASCGAGEHGRGLLIVHQVASAHGDRIETGRALHWAELTTAA